MSGKTTLVVRVHVTPETIFGWQVMMLRSIAFRHHQYDHILWNGTVRPPLGGMS